MPGCVLRAAGTDFPVDDFLRSSNLKPLDVYRKGEVKDRQGKLYQNSGLTVLVCEDDGDDFARQIREATAFLERYGDEIRRLLSFQKGIGARLDFGIRRREVFVQSHYFPPELLQLAATLGLGLELSAYSANEA